VIWVSFPLHPDTPSEGVLFSELYDPDALRKKMDPVWDFARRIGIPFTRRKRRYNPRLAHELYKWVEERLEGFEFHKRVFRAYFVDQLNIAQISVLVGIAESLGLPGKEAREALENRAYRERVDEEWRSAEAMGISAVPSCVLGNRVVVGAQPYNILECFVKDCGVPNRTHRNCQE
jgi:predicted DsbA family dithiol-disulfide isomerase